MKKLMIIFAMMALLPFVATAQRGTPRSNNVSVSVKRVTETTVEKDYKTYNARVGFQQMAGINIGTYEFEGFGLGISYVGGYRFNDWLFAGAGVEFNSCIDYTDFYVPIYAHLRTYFTKRIWRPYISLSLGGSYYYDEYFDRIHDFGSYGGFCGDFSVGADARLTENLNLFMAAGVNNMGFFLKTGLSF